jgi:hypothetical protein
VRQLGLENLHERVIAAASDLFSDEHYQSSVSEAFKSVEVRVRDLAQLGKSGAPLMGDAIRSGRFGSLGISAGPGMSSAVRRRAQGVSLRSRHAR